MWYAVTGGSCGVCKIIWILIGDKKTLYSMVTDSSLIQAIVCHCPETLLNRNYNTYKFIPCVTKTFEYVTHLLKFSRCWCGSGKGARKFHNNYFWYSYSFDIFVGICHMCVRNWNEFKHIWLIRMTVQNLTWLFRKWNVTMTFEMGNLPRWSVSVIFFFIVMIKSYFMYNFRVVIKLLNIQMTKSLMTKVSNTKDCNNCLRDACA